MKWRFIPGWEGFYQVSQMGQVRSVSRRLFLGAPYSKTSKLRLFRGRVLSPSISTGYPVVTLSRPGKQQRAYIHDLVMKTFHGPKPKGKEVCHNDGDGFNCSLNNLRYDSRRANSLDRFAHGTVAKQIGVENANAKLSTKEVSEIRNLAGTVSQRHLGRRFRVSHSVIGRVIRKQSYF